MFEARPRTVYLPRLRLAKVKMTEAGPLSLRFEILTAVELAVNVT